MKRILSFFISFSALLKPTVVLFCLCLQTTGELRAQSVEENEDTSYCKPQQQALSGKQLRQKVTNYWKETRFTPLINKTDSLKFEQRFADFAWLCASADSATQRDAIAQLFHKKDDAKGTFQYLLSLAEKYLYRSTSPYSNEELFLFFLREEIQCKQLTDTEKIRPAFLLQLVARNRTGQKATDFSYVTRQGERGRLSTTSVNHRLLLLLIDPHCKRCQQLTAKLRADKNTNRLIAQDSLRILAINVDADQSLWNLIKDDLPANWTAATDKSEIMDNSLYDLKSLPAVYLLDKDKRVVLKMPTDEELLQVLKQP